jgi:hypothetical protein
MWNAHINFKIYLFNPLAQIQSLKNNIYPYLLSFDYLIAEIPKKQDYFDKQKMTGNAEKKLHIQ